MEDSTLRKSLSILTHPLTIAAILVLLINDHYLRIYYPSWITGKLGDFAWLYLSPLALATVLGLLLPRRLKDKSKTVILVSVGLISGVFLVGKTSLQVNSWMREGMSLLLGVPVSLHRDPTDLIALPAASGAYLAWIRHRTPASVNYRKGFVLLAISAALTVANAAEPDYGITCLDYNNGRLIAMNNRYDSYESWDGGLSWQLVRIEDEDRCDPYFIEEIEISVPDNDLFLYRADGGSVLEESLDGGKSWTPLSFIEPLNQAEIAWMEQTRSVFYQPGPLSAVSDPVSGNLVFAMGLEGALVRTAGGEWIPVDVGDYRLVNLTLDSFPGLLKYEIYCAAAYAILLLITEGIFSGSSLFQKIWLGLVWGAWMIILLLFQPALSTGYTLFLINAGVIFLVVSSITLVALYLTRTWESFKSHWIQSMGIVLTGLMIVLAPYVLWALNLIPEYLWSMALSFCLGLILLAVRVNRTKKNRA